MNILTYPNPLLSKLNLPLNMEDPLLKDTVLSQAQEMLDLMHKSNGVGLAAPQVGWNIRLFVFNETSDRKDDKIVISPDINPTTDEHILMSEGCLSVPNTCGKVKRWTKISMLYWTFKDNNLVWAINSFDGLAAHIIQHEMDHLDGMLYIEKLSPAEYSPNKKVIKLLEQYENSK